MDPHHWILAQQSAAPAVAPIVDALGINALMAILAPLGVGGILAWFLWYTAATWIPSLMKENRELVSEICRSNDQKTSAMASAFTESLREERDLRRSEMMAFRCTGKHQQ